MKKVLIIEDDANIYSQLMHQLETLGCKSTHASGITEAQSFQLQDFDLILSKLALADGSAIDILTAKPICPLIILAEANESAAMLEAIRAGANDCIIKPIDNTELKTAISRALQLPAGSTINTVVEAIDVKTDRRCHSSKQEEQAVQPICGMIGTSPLMQTVYTRIRKAAPTRSTILIRGETGTGKELVAQAIHDTSDRAGQPFIAVNCAAIPETLIEAELFGHEKGAFTGAASKRSGLIEAAEGGTLFLDEIGELPSEAQARLLRFIQESEIRRIGSNEAHSVNVRLIAATHRDLKKLTTTGGFRPDLYYRINVVRIDLPPLKKRGDDLLEIAEHLLEKAANRHDKPGLHLLPEAIQAINSYSWPGNVRELENVIERAAIMSESLSIGCDALEIDTDQIENQRFNAEILTPFTGNYLGLHQPTLASTGTLSHRSQTSDPSEDLSLEDYFQRFVIENQETMNETELAKKLGISRKCLWERRQRFGIPRNKNGKSSGGML